MRKTLTALLFAAALPTVAMAMPDGGPRHDGPHHRGGPAFHELDLSREQRDQMKQRRDITERYLDKLPAADQKAMKQEMQASRDKTDAAVRNLLKPDQQKKFDELQKERAAKKAEWQEFQAWKAEKAGKSQ